MNKPLRTPIREPIPQTKTVKLKKMKWVEPQQKHLVMGVDPGLGTLGVVVLEQLSPDLQPKVLLAKVIQTKKADKKLRSNLRVTNDDQRRYKEIWSKLSDIATEYDVYGVGLEAYRVFEGRGGNAWKTAVVYGGIIFWAHTRNLYIAPFLPTDLKKRFCDKKSASKKEVENRLCFLIEGLEDKLKKIPKTKREHVADAAGHAFLILEEVAEHRKMLGIC